MAKLNINGRTHDVDVEPTMPLLWAIREHVGLTGTKYGCGVAQCGSCTVHIDGAPVRSCVTPVSSLGNKAIRTLDGLEKNGKPHPVQAAFADEQAAQCGYCSNGWIMHSVALLEKNPRASEAQIRQGLAGVQCRCGTHIAILRAVKKAGVTMTAAADGETAVAEVQSAATSV